MRIASLQTHESQPKLLFISYGNIIFHIGQYIFHAHFHTHNFKNIVCAWCRIYFYMFQHVKFGVAKLNPVSASLCR